MRFLFYILTIGSAISSCSKEIEIQLPVDKIMPVLNCIIQSDTNFVVDMSLSKPIQQIDMSFEPIKNATVKLYVNNVQVDILKPVVNTSFYKSKYKAQQGNKIKIEATAIEINQPLISETIVPMKPVVESGSGTILQTNGMGNKVYQFEVSLSDPPKADDFYRVRIFPVRSDSVKWNEPVYFSIPNIDSEAGGIFDIFDDDNQDRQVYFADDSFNGKKLNLIIKSNSPSQIDKVAIEISAVTEEMYLYYKSLKAQRRHNNDPLYEKVEIFSNVQNGLGILGSLSSIIVFQKITR